jgi:hypothetical protein
LAYPVAPLGPYRVPPFSVSFLGVINHCLDQSRCAVLGRLDHESFYSYIPNCVVRNTEETSIRL